MPVQLGVNLSFCVKRWVTPELWAPLVRDRLKLERVQFSFDLVDPTWPELVLSQMAESLRAVPERHGITVHSAFIGLAHYTFNQLLHPVPGVRDHAEAWMRHAYRFAAAAGITRVGGPLGAIASAPDGYEAEALPEAEYAELISRMRRLAQAGAEAGLETLYVEPTPMRREWPWTIAQAQRMLADLAGTPIPWQLCPDWGHGTFAPLYGPDHAGMADWFAALAPDIGAIHIQQTDYLYDRHWDFTEPGRVDPAAAFALLARSGLGDRPVFLEAFYPFERADRSVLDAMARSVEILKAAASQETCAE
ncbi:TIM barrel protein [Acidimangrovimonas sediminis]|uniref:TIM barrel protein n=1 Tax=Acidimangrovimonas sediminis TaxID=2056283 RepID=UPI0018ECF9F2|nr:TIM barrel protein [Acidimangrovimonas sediminis]